MITPGAILIDKDALHPICFELQDDVRGSFWHSISRRLTPHQLEQELVAAGWTFFYMANVIKATVFGFDRTKMINIAVQRLIEGVRLEHCNCLEIQDVTEHSFFGIPYVTVRCHPRHIQRGLVFAGQ